MIAPGRYADLVVLPRTSYGDAKRLESMKVLMTMVGGKKVRTPTS